MGRFDRKDSFYMKAKAEGKASRAYYKLEQIQQKYQIIKRGDRVVDLGCAPGGWIQEAVKIVGSEGRIFGIDLLPVHIGALDNVTIKEGDINEPSLISEIKKTLGNVSVVLSDIAPDISGIKFKDSYLSYELAMRALNISREILKEGGNFIVKIFPGEEFVGFKKEMKKNFSKVIQHRPPATRKSSIEIYLVGIGFHKNLHPSTGSG